MTVMNVNYVCRYYQHSFNWNIFSNDIISHIYYYWKYAKIIFFLHCIFQWNEYIFRSFSNTLYISKYIKNTRNFHTFSLDGVILKRVEHRLWILVQVHSFVADQTAQCVMCERYSSMHLRAKFQLLKISPMVEKITRK